MPFILGMRNDGQGRLIGQVDELRLDRAVLDATSIQELVNGR